MAIRRSDIARLSGSDEYADHLLRARRRFEQGQAATLHQVRDVYRRAAEEIRKDIISLTPGTLRHAHLTALQTALDKRAATMSKEVLTATHQGIWVASAAGSRGVANVTATMTAGTFQSAQVQSMFAGINERATMAMLARTRQDGLKISDRVWRTSERARNSIRLIVEDAVARGQNARTTAKEVQKYLQPGVWTAHKAETRRRLGVHKDVSYEAMRLARTEMNNAFHEGMVAANQHSPGYRGIYWRLSLGRVMPRPDVCDDMAADASHGEPGFYPKGKEPVRPHPSCLCVTVSAWENPEQFTERLREWTQNPQLQPDLEKWYNESAKRFMGRPWQPALAVPPALPVAPAPPAMRYAPAETLKQAEEWTTNQLAKSVSYAGGKKWGGKYPRQAEALEKLNAINEEFTRLKQQYPRLAPTIDVLYVTRHERGKATLGIGRAPYIVTTKGKATPEQITARNVWENRFGRRWGVERPENAIKDNFRHELAHNLTTRATLDEWTRAVQQNPELGTEQWLKQNISEYAATNKYETIAESYTLVTAEGYRRGTLPALIENMVERMMGGS